MILQRCIPISAFNDTERLKWCHCHCSRVCPRSRALSLSRISIPAAWQKLEPSWHDSEHRRHCDASRRQFSSPLFPKSSILSSFPRMCDVCMCVCVCVCVCVCMCTNAMSNLLQISGKEAERVSMEIAIKWKNRMENKNSETRRD